MENLSDKSPHCSMKTDQGLLRSISAVGKKQFV